MALPQAARQRLPRWVLDEADRVDDPMARGEGVDAGAGLLQGLAVERPAVQVEVELAGQPDLVDPLRNLADGGLGPGPGTVRA
jgi:hypothetical protein